MEKQFVRTFNFSLKIIVYLVLVFFLDSCNNKVDYPYIFSVEDAKEKAESNNIDLPPPPLEPYSPLNFVINKNDLYFFSLPFNDELSCGTGVDFSLNPFINLKPSQLIKIPKEAINSFLQNNISEKRSYSLHFTISSTSDTLNKEIYKVFTEFKKKWKKEKNKSISINLIRSTEEINTVLSYYENGNSYFSEKVKWKNKFKKNDKIVLFCTFKALLTRENH